ncbi:diguanylate cyclase (GGDEF) domain-containing protein [Acidovorax sp. CF316]|uniref:sensor domain-containing diguanylate cyclase n=1 Tax=Acidovorax sp. CF316 TaxID=1144317 RepID=UPI00026BDA93|nr:sensor domain-containing diguanylate cyclase [Acidovorax sp. CF316]EJE54955.1 diguanylate cyclase (GGDEF) domain-containing protein [Acidovorax sp. CF316]
MTHPTRFHGQSLRTQISLVFAVLVVGLAVLLSLGFGELLQLRIQRDASRALHTVADNASRQLAQGLYERSRVVQVLADAPGIWEHGLGSVEVRQLLARSQAIDPHSLWIGVADVQGVVRAATKGLLEGESVRERPWFIAGLAQLHVGDVHPAKLLETLLPPNTSGEPHRFVDFAAPIRTGQTTVGVLGMHGSWEWTREVLQSLAPVGIQGASVDLFVFDRTGKLIFAPPEHRSPLEAGGQRLPVPLTVATRESGTRPASVVPWADGKNYLTSSVRMEARNAPSDLGWHIVAREPVEVAFAEANRAVHMAVVIGLLAAVLASGLAWIAVRRLSEDLYVLADAASLVESGKPGATIPLVTHNREVHQLSSALSGMTQRLMAAHEAMEDKVRVRTLELEAANRALDLQARTDALTGLLNRRGFDSRMEFALALARRSGRPLSLVSVDVDHFKRVNDSFGHEAGDEVLRRLALTLQQRLRASDVIARLGGEEFAVVLPDTDLDGARAIAQSIVDGMAAQDDPLVGRITVSAGIASLRPGQDSAHEMMRRSDAALYEAKGQGRNRVCVEPEAGPVLK